MKKFIFSLFILSSAWSLQGQTTIFLEDFEGASPSVSTSSASGSTNLWTNNSTYSVSGSNSYTADVQLSDTIFLQTNVINASTAVFLTLNFNQICKIDFFDKAIVEVSTNNGTSWTQLTSAEYSGSGFLNGNGFSSISYSDWNAANGAALPLNAWWKAETFDLTALAAGNSQVIIRFGLIDLDNNGARNNYGWLIDDIQLVAASCELVPPTIALAGTSYQGTVYSQGPYNIQADIQDASGIASASLTYTNSSGGSGTLPMSVITGNIYQATIPSAVIGDTVCYSISATDATSCGNMSSLPSLGCIQFIVNANPPPSCSGFPVNTFNYQESFANFNPGNGTNNNPGSLANDWVNETTGDTHDWWVYDNNTRSNNTGPSQDHSPADANYVYVEASNFANNTAILNTPCYDFTNLSAPQFRFWYHMYGATMGSLHLDIFFGGQWVQDIMPPISGDQSDSWFLREVDLSAYAGAIVKLRFRGITGTSYTSDIAIDDVEIEELLQDDIFLTEIISPNPTGCSGTANEFITVGLQNDGFATQTEIPLAYQLNGGAVVRDTARLTLASGNTANFSFQQTVNMLTPGSYSFDAWVEMPSDLNNSNDSVIGYAVSSSAINSAFPDTTNFDSFVVGVPGTLLDGWSNSQTDALDWNVNTGFTPSNQTGPLNGDNTSGSGNYIYIEATNSFNLEAVLYSKCYDISSLNVPELTFFYHMRGIEMGELHVDISINGFEVRDIINPIAGDQGGNWNIQVIDLSPFKGVVKVIFRGITGPGYRSDIAIDDVSIRDAQPIGILEKKEELQGISVYPNPFEDEIIINSENLVLGYSIFDLSGKEILSNYLANPSRLFNLKMDEYSSGMYFIRINTEKGQTIRKISKK